MPSSTRIFRVFVSSTFADWSPERNLLQREVWPEVARKCRALGYRFQAIDLRWGVSEEALRTGKLMELCLAEIARCQRLSPKPNFLLLVGDRYGYRPLPEKIETTDLQDLLDSLSAGDKQFLIGDGRPGQGWYHFDQNEIADDNVGIWRLRGWDGRVTNAEQWKQTEAQLAKLLRRATVSWSFERRSACGVDISATEREFRAAVKDKRSARDHVLAVVRRLGSVPDNPLSSDVVAYQDWVFDGTGWLRDREAEVSNRRFREEVSAAEGLSARRVRRYDLAWDSRASEEYLKTFAFDMLRDVSSIIDEAIEETIEATPEAREAAVEQAFAEGLTHNFVGRQTTLRETLDRLDNATTRLFAVTGVPGSGKSAFLARLQEELCKRNPEAMCISRFCGVSPNTSVVTNFLRDMARRFSAVDGQPPNEPAPDASPAELWRAALAAIPPAHPVFLLLDGIDHLVATDGEPVALDWLALTVPDLVRIVVSCPTEEVWRLPASLERIEMHPLAADEAKLACDLRLKARSRTLQYVQWTILEELFTQCALPLYVSIVSDFAVEWSSDDSLPRLAANLDDLISQRLDFWAAPERHGATLLSRALAYLRNSQSGLAEDEWLGLLSRDEEAWAEFERRARHPPPERRLPDAVWSRLLLDLQSWLHEISAGGVTTLDFFHGAVKKACVNRCFSGPDARRQFDRRMADFFESQALQTDTNRSRGRNILVGFTSAQRGRFTPFAGGHRTRVRSSRLALISCTSVGPTGWLSRVGSAPHITVDELDPTARAGR